MKNNPGKTAAFIMLVSLIINILYRDIMSIFNDYLFIISTVLEIVTIIILFKKKHNPAVTVLLFLDILITVVNIYYKYSVTHPFSDTGIFLVEKLTYALYIIPPILLFVMSLYSNKFEISSKVPSVIFVVVTIANYVIMILADKQAEALDLSIDYVINLQTHVSLILSLIMVPLQNEYLVKYIYEY